jgi:hypothetical protein
MYYILKSPNMRDFSRNLSPQSIQCRWRVAQFRLVTRRAGPGNSHASILSKMLLVPYFSSEDSTTPRVRGLIFGSGGLCLGDPHIREVCFPFNNLDRIYVLAESFLERTERFGNILHVLIRGFRGIHDCSGHLSAFRQLRQQIRAHCLHKFINSLLIKILRMSSLSNAYTSSPSVA